MYCDTVWHETYGWIRYIEDVKDCAGTRIHGVTKVVDDNNDVWYYSKTPFKFPKLGMKNERGLANVILSNRWCFNQTDVLWAEVIRIMNYC